MTAARPARPPSRPVRASQRGATLLVGLIMLALLTLHALAAFSVGGVQLRIVGNAQERLRAQAAAEVAIARVLSSTAFITAAQQVAVTPVDVDIDGDGASDFRVSVTPGCTAARPLRAADLDPGVPDDLQCIAGTAFGAGSLCVATHWDLQAVAVPAATGPATGARAETGQGVVVRLDAGAARTHC